MPSRALLLALAACASAPPPAADGDRLQRVLKHEVCPCGAPHDLWTCSREHKDCPTGEHAATFAARLIQDGRTDDEISHALLQRFWKPRPPEVDVRGCPMVGDATAPVTIVEFADFECPHCRRLAPVLKQLVDDEAGKVRLYFKHYPLAQHAHAADAARAAAAADAQGKFWPMHERLMTVEEMAREDLVRYATELGLDAARFTADLDGDAAKARVAADRAEGDRLGVRGTPALFIDGVEYTGGRALEDLKKRVDEELAARGG